jgi:hypothetical protein
LLAEQAGVFQFNGGFGFLQHDFHSFSGEQEPETVLFCTPDREGKV